MLKKESQFSGQKGFASILTVLSLSIVLVTSLLTVYIYVVNRSRHFARIREAYDLMDVMEEAAKSVRSAWDSAAAADIASASCTSPNTPTSDICAKQIATDTAQYVKNAGCKSTIGPVAPCCAVCQTLVTGGVKPDLCYNNAVNPASPYCFYGLGAATNMSTAFLQWGPAPASLKKSLKPEGRLERFYARLDRFFEGASTNSFQNRHDALKAPTLFGWILNEKKALAASSTWSQPNVGVNGAASTNSLNMNLTYCGAGSLAAAGSPTCIACGNGTGHICAAITACPADFLQCYDPGNTVYWNPAGQAPMFAQEFVLAAPGVCGGGTGYSPNVCF